MPGPRVAVTAIFFLNGLAFSSWYARLEAIQDDLAIGTGLVGLALLGAPLGLVVAQPLVGALIARRGSPAVLAFAPVAIAAVLLPALAVDVLTLLAAAFVVGALNGALDIAMNAQGIAVERRLGRRLFTSLHAGFSFGALAGAGLAALAVGAGLAPAAHLLAVAIVAAAVAAALRPAFMDDADSAGAATPSFARPTRALAIAGTVAFCALLAEGAIFDWSGIFLSPTRPAQATPSRRSASPCSA